MTVVLAQSTSTNMTEPQQLILIAEVERLLRTPPLPSVEALDYVRSFLLRARRRCGGSSTARVHRAGGRRAADGLAWQRRAKVNTHRGAVRRCRSRWSATRSA